MANLFDGSNVSKKSIIQLPWIGWVWEVVWATSFSLLSSSSNFVWQKSSLSCDNHSTRSSLASNLMLISKEEVEEDEERQRRFRMWLLVLVHCVVGVSRMFRLISRLTAVSQRKLVRRMWRLDIVFSSAIIRRHHCWCSSPSSSVVPSCFPYMTCPLAISRPSSTGSSQRLFRSSSQK